MKRELSLSRRSAIGAALMFTSAGAAKTAPKKKIMEGGRPFPFDPTVQNKGRALIRAESGLVLKEVAASNFGNGLLRVATDVEGLIIEDVEAENFYRLLECDKGASLSRFVVRRIKAEGFERSLARLRGDSANGLFEDIHADSRAQMGDPFAVGFHLDERCRDITFRRCSVSRCQAPVKQNVYRQGDGFCDEAECRNITYVDTLAQECTDGGYDLKSKNLTMVRARAISNSRNFRFWSDASIESISSVDPTASHISTHGRGGRTLRIERLEARSDRQAPLFHLAALGGTRVSIGSHNLSLPPGTKLMTVDSRGNSIDWGPQGAPKL